MEPADVLRVVVGCTACGYRDGSHRVRTRWSGPTLERPQDAPVATGRDLRLGAEVPGRVLDVVPVEGDDLRCDACRAIENLARG